MCLHVLNFSSGCASAVHHGFFALWTYWSYRYALSSTAFVPCTCCRSRLWLICMLALNTYYLSWFHAAHMHMPYTIAIPYANVIYLYHVLSMLIHILYCLCCIHMLTTYCLPLVLCCPFHMPFNHGFLLHGILSIWIYVVPPQIGCMHMRLYTYMCCPSWSLFHEYTVHMYVYCSLWLLCPSISQYAWISSIYCSISLILLVITWFIWLDSVSTVL